ncbi:MAG TPA: ethanolamine ammonia-lyase subunit EutC [Stellaceae bacterium]|nr:ethanolamine ammonia-lyase subunit EutC [Stellaceae bacterium]
MNWLEVRRATPARIGLGRSGTALPTAAQLDFQLAHARARDAVYATLDSDRILAELRAHGLKALTVRSQAADRATYLRRPDLGRKLAAASRRLLLRHSGPRRDDESGARHVAFVIADGLSATAVNAHAAPLMAAVLLRLDGWRVAPVAVVEQGRVAIGDEIGGLLGADLAAVLIGERPGLSAADSLGVYVTWAPAPGTVDAARHCLSNIRPAGMPIDEAADALIRLMAAARQHRMTGVALSQRLAGPAG